MKIPKRFKLMGQLITVEETDELVIAAQMEGVFLLRENKIKLQGSGHYPKSKVEQTFCHELVHGILEAMNEDDLSNNEKFVDIFSGLLHQALTTMEYK